MIGIETNRKSSRLLLWITLAVVLVLYGFPFIYLLLT
jgi:multiple sugar transport system permease protein